MAADKTSLEELSNNNSNYLNDELDQKNHLQKIRTVGSVAMTAELFEKLYVSPQTKVKGDLRKTFGNPTPIALVGFIMALTPLSCDLMGWRGAGGSGAAEIGAYYFFGGLLQVITGLLEWILGNTFSSVVFSSFGAFFLTFGATLTPSFAAFSTYAVAGDPTSTGLETKGFNASFGYFMLFMGLLCVVYLICALRVNICFVMIFFTLILTFSFLTGAYFVLAMNYTGNAVLSAKLLKAAGASAFVTSAFGWWTFFAMMLASIDFPISLPVGDLSKMIKPASSKA
ncbi:gpr1-like plasma membrane protein [Grosmannia clavigera kw1407]|uniref:Gpr1-like plasma membrane protein n=1 Tax=Grosmannia clavigera (strain kw1407 / UAMH 11150) TaxID=655863 RepID=F0XBH7_GROCL|nr:gpr1-like plasma membrane protein [Grosmannia clavigera kw1407]EFX04936.1 gpr1-like plasma membrane protein [Grosmannia clavigera kw1407]